MLTLSMSSLHKHLGSPYWYCAYRLANGRRVLKSTKKTDKKEAKLLLDAWERAEELAGRGSVTEARLREILNQTLERCELGPMETLSRAEYLHGWLAGRKPLVEPSTYTVYAQTVNAFLGYLGERAQHRLETLDERDIASFQAHLLAGGRAESTVAKLMKYLREPITLAAESGKLPRNPFALVPRLRAQSVSKERFSTQDVAALVKAARGTEWEGLILLGYTSGMRLMDAVSLRHSDIDRQAGVISFIARKTKNSGSRKSVAERKTVIGLHEDFKDWLARRPIPFHKSAHVFAELLERASVSGATKLSADFAKLLGTAGIENKVLREPSGKGGSRVYALGFHSFRHGAASAIFSAQVIRQVAGRVTGHAERGSLDTYLHVDIDAAREAVKLIPRLPAAS